MIFLLKMDNLMNELVFDKQYIVYLTEYKENKLTNEMFSRNIQFFNDNLDFNVLDQLNVSPLNVIDFNDYENILIINDIYNIYSSYIIDIYDKSVYAIASSENNSMVDFLKLKDKFNVINLKLYFYIVFAFFIVGSI